MTNEELDGTIQIPDCIKPKTKFFCAADKNGKGGVEATCFNATMNYSRLLKPMPVRLMILRWVAFKPEKSGVLSALRWTEFLLN